MYYKVMYWTLNSYFYNFKSTMNDVAQINTRFDQEYSIVEQGFKKVGNSLLKLAEGIPVIGGFMGYLEGAVDFFADTYYEHKFTNKANAIKKIIQAKMKSDEDMSKTIQKTVIEIIRD